MRLASAEVKHLLGHGQRSSASAADVVLTSRSVVPAAQQSSNPALAARIALAVPKRQLRRAVDRNRAKRILREAFRQHELRRAPLEMLVTVSAVPKIFAGNLNRKQVSSHFRAAAVGLFDRLLQRSKKDVRAG